MTFLKKHVIKVLLILAISNLIMFVYVYKNNQKKEYLIQDTYNIIENFKDLLSALKDAETGQRGYLLSNRKAYLEPYYNGIKDSEKYFKKVKLLTSNKTKQQINLKSIDNLIQQKFKELEQTIEISKHNKQESIALLNSDYGKNIMDKIRDLIKEYISVEEKLLDKRKKSFNTQNSIILILFIIEFIFIFSLLILVNNSKKNTQLLISRLDDSLNITDKHVVYSKTDAKGIITETSLAFEQLSGYKKNELIGKKHNIIRHPDNSKDFFKKIWKIIKSGKSWQGLIKNRKKDGSTYFVMSTINPIYGNKGNIEGFISFRQDVTQQKKQEEQLLAQSRMAQMGEMISMIAHQWRQPLGAISSTAIDLNMQIEFENFDLEKERGRQECQTYLTNGLEEIDGFVQNLTNTIDDFRNFYKPNKERDTVLINEIVSKALNIIKPSCISDGIEIVDINKSKNLIIAYSNELMQVILNILKNAEDNFKEKAVSDPKIFITSTDKDNKVILEINDNGGGISEDILPKIFDPYFSTKDELNGTGLGLYMSKIIIEEHHNGSLEVINLDDGVCFVITIKPTL